MKPANFAMKSIVCIIFNDVQATILDFNELWVDKHNNAVKTMLAAMSLHLIKLKDTLHIDLYSRIFGYCIQVVVMRIVLFLKTRSKSGSTFDAHEIQRLKKDIGEIKSFVNNQVQLIDNKYTSVAFVNDQLSNQHQTIDALLHVSNTSIRKYQLLTHGTSSGKWLALSSLQTLNILSDLITEKYDTTEFISACKYIVDNYSTVPAKKMKLHHSNIVNSRTDHHYISELLLLTIAPSLRYDSKDNKLTSSLKDTILHHKGGSSHPYDSNDIQQYKHDIIVRLFGSIDNYGSSANNNSNNTSNNNINISASEVSSSEQLHDQNKHEHHSHSHINFKHLISPVTAMKHLRDVASDTVKKASDNMAHNLIKSRYNEEKAVHLMRVIGLEVSRASLHHLDLYDRNDNNNIGTPTKLHKRPSATLSSSSSSNLLLPAHRNSTSRNLLFDYDQAAATNTCSKLSTDDTPVRMVDRQMTNKGRDGKDNNKYKSDQYHIQQQIQQEQEQILPCWKNGDHIPVVAIPHAVSDKDMMMLSIANTSNRIEGSSRSVGLSSQKNVIVINGIQVKGLQSSALFDGPNPYVYFTLRYA